MSFSDATLFGRIALAALLGLIIGFERESRGKPAGERTFALVALGAAAFTGLSVDHFPNADRVIQGVVAGVGFLGAGIIFQRERGMVKGLTTASAAWSVASIGVLVGIGEYIVGLATAALVLLILEFDRLPIMRHFHLIARRSEDQPPPSPGA